MNALPGTQGCLYWHSGSQGFQQNYQACSDCGQHSGICSSNSCDTSM